MTSKAQEKIMHDQGRISVSEAARMLGITNVRVHQLLDSGKLLGLDINLGGERRKRYVNLDSLVKRLGDEAARAFGLIK